MGPREIAEITGLCHHAQLKSTFLKQALPLIFNLKENLAIFLPFHNPGWNLTNPKLKLKNCTADATCCFHDLNLWRKYIPPIVFFLRAPV